MAVLAAAEAGLQNFSLLVAHMLVSPAIAAPRAAPDSRVQGFLVAGHVRTMMGCNEYEPTARRCGVLIVVTASEPVDLLQGILSCLRQPEAGRAEGENADGRSVRPRGDAPAQAAFRQVFAVVPRGSGGAWVKSPPAASILRLPMRGSTRGHGVARPSPPRRAPAPASGEPGSSCRGSVERRRPSGASHPVRGRLHLGGVRDVDAGQ